MSKLHENMDELLFDYFEGNLSTEKMTEVENMVNSNPELTAEFTAWKNAFVPQEKEDYPLAHTLIAGSGTAWMRWTTLLLILGLGTASLIYFIPDAKNGQNQAYSHKNKSGLTTKLTDKGVVNSSSETTFAKNKASIYQPEKKLSQTTLPVNQSGNVFETKNGNSKSQGKQLLPNNALQGKQNPNSKNESSASDKNNGTKSNPHDSNTLGKIHESPKATTKPNKNGSKSHTSALEQAMAYFDFGNGSSANQFDVYASPQPSSYLNPNERKNKTSSNNLLDRLSRKIIFGMGQQLAFTNLKDPYFLNPYYQSPLETNPALSGSAGRFRLKSTINSMNGIGLTVGADMPIGKTNFSIGIYGQKQDYILYDYFEQNQYLAGVSASYNLKFNRSTHLRIGSSVSYSERTLKMIPENTNNVTVEGFETKNDVEINIGTHLNTKYFYMGVNARNLLGNQSVVAEYSDINIAYPFNLGRGINAYIGTDYLLKQNKNLVFSPQISYLSYGKQHDFWSGAQAQMHWFVFGASISNHWDFSGNLGLNLKGNRIIYQYGDVSTNFLDRQHIHKLSIRLLLGKKGYSNDLPLVNE